jgi:Protein of unknown function (DUF4245)/Thiamine pyrophosphokinase C terminal
MTPAKRRPPIVAGLGRPELPEEKAVRLAENSRLYRSRKTVNNLVLSLLATLVALLVIVLIVPRSETPLYSEVDYHSVAKEAERSVDIPLADPELPTGWQANAAEWSPGGSAEVASWYVGFLTPSSQFIGLTQAIDANPTWLAEALQKQAAVETVTIEGVTWDVYRNTTPEKDRGNFEYALVTASGSNTYLLIGTAVEAEFRVLAEALTAEVTSNGSAVG